MGPIRLKAFLYKPWFLLFQVVLEYSYLYSPRCFSPRHIIEILVWPYLAVLKIELISVLVHNCVLGLWLWVLLFDQLYIKLLLLESLAEIGH
jgi:hypothetical protein